ncbi:hypothetical protein [Nonomuraea fuscirosea]|uniref:hypothetical protein n=1 Tax=Nonomuraea fuscirosea TaxID=1291556 RepID=UPI0011B21DC8|nr:hypothetical protein [Nonomuraea fuscirosea]
MNRTDSHSQPGHEYFGTVVAAFARTIAPIWYARSMRTAARCGNTTANSSMTDAEQRPGTSTGSHQAQQERDLDSLADHGK